MALHPQPVQRRARALTLGAWSVTIAISAVPDIAFHLVAGAVPLWLTTAKVLLLVALGGLALSWRRLRPLGGYLVALFAMLSLSEARASVDFSWLPLQALFGNSAFDQRMQAEQTGKLVVALGVIAVLLALGLKRRDFFFTRGNLQAPIGPVPLLGFPKPDPWPRFGLQWGLYIAVALAIVQYLGIRPAATVWPRLLPLAPSILFYAALNAFNEELTYRAPMLATLEPLIGGRQALWMSAFFFGIAHYFGTPGGLMGGVLSIFMGWILGKGMLETRGLFWPWWIHVLSDIALFTFLAAQLVA